MRRRAQLLTSICAVLAAGFAPARLEAGDMLPRLRWGPPLLLRLDAVIAASRAEATRAAPSVASYTVLGSRAPGVEHWLGVTEARTVGGDHALDGKDVLDAVAPFNPMLLIAGTPRLVDALEAASVGTTVRIEGLVDRASRMYYLRSVAVPFSTAP